jgi:hypothetical protein
MRPFEEVRRIYQRLIHWAGVLRGVPASGFAIVRTLWKLGFMATVKRPLGGRHFYRDEAQGKKGGL